MVFRILLIFNMVYRVCLCLFRFKDGESRSSLVVPWVKDLVLPQLWHRPQQQHGFNPWPFHLTQVWPK